MLLFERSCYFSVESRGSQKDYVLTDFLTNIVKQRIINCITSKYRVIHKSLRDFRPLRYSSRDGHAEEEHVNRGRDTPSFCPASAIPGSRDMLTSEGS